jgi:hypothetical protein
MSTVVLLNSKKRPPRMLVLNLTRLVASVTVENRTTEESRDGARRKRVSQKSVPDSLRIPAGASVEVPASYLGCPDVAAAVARRDVVVLRKEPVAALREGPKSEKRRRRR